MSAEPAFTTTETRLRAWSLHDKVFACSAGVYRPGDALGYGITPDAVTTSS
jgi:hypothetical protein